MARLGILALAALIAAVSVVTVASSGNLRGGMTSNTGSDTTFVFTPHAREGVLLVNPDAECAFEIIYGSSSKTVVLTGNSSLFVPGFTDTVKTNPSTTQRVGVYATD